MNSEPSGTNVLLVTNVPTPYRIPLFNELARQIDKRGYTLKVVFGARGYARRSWKIDWEDFAFEYEVLDGRTIRLGSFEKYMFTYPGLLRLIRREKPAVIVCPGFSVATTIIRISRYWRTISYIIWSGETARRSKLQNSAFRLFLRRYLVKGAGGFVAYGSESKHHLCALGASPEDISIAINTVDTEYFAKISKKRSHRKPPGNKFVLLVVTSLVPGKQIETVIEIATRLAERRSDFEVQIVGNGPERENLENLARQRGVSDCVRFAGYLQRSEVAKALSEATCFLFPTHYDIWGLVLVEAMAAGLPCFTSVNAGATPDLITDGVNGYAVDFSNSELVTQRIDDLLNDPDKTKKIGFAAQSFIKKNASLTKSAEGFVNAIEAAVNPNIATPA